MHYTDIAVSSAKIENIILRTARTRRISDTDLDILIRYIHYLRELADTT